MSRGVDDIELLKRAIKHLHNDLPKLGDDEDPHFEEKAIAHILVAQVLLLAMNTPQDVMEAVFKVSRRRGVEEFQELLDGAVTIQ